MEISGGRQCFSTTTKKAGFNFFRKMLGGDEFGCGMKNVKIIKSGDFSLKMLFQTLVLLSTNFEMLVGFPYIEFLSSVFFYSVKLKI